MLSFQGRSAEIKILKDEYKKDQSSLVVIYGRRRVGKSALIHHFSKDLIFLHFDGLEHESTINQIEHFKNQLKAQVNDPLLEDIVWKAWSKPLDYLTRYIQDQNKKVVVFFDEYQWLSCQQSKLTSLIKSYWDNQWSKSNKFYLVFCGSVSSFMVKKVVHSKSLYGRINLEMQINPLPLNDIFLMLRHKRSESECLKYYLVFGGIPKYFESIVLNKSLPQNIQDLCFTKTAEYFNEYEKIFYSQFKEPKTYERIISFLNLGPKSYSEIIRELKIKDGGGAKSYLTNLEIAGFIQIKSSLFQKNKVKKYFISDEFLRFYHKYILPNKAIINQGFSKDLFKSKIQPVWASWLGYSFELFCRKNALLLAQIMGFASEVQNVGSFSLPGEKNLNKGCQFDLIYHRGDVLTVCEVKYSESPIGLDVVDEMKSKLKIALPFFKDYSTIEFALIAPSGITMGLKNSNFFHHVVVLSDLF